MTRTVTGTTPYAWPWHGRLDPASAAVLVITPAGDGLPQGPEQEQAARVVDAVIASGGRVVHVTTLPPGRPSQAPVPPASTSGTHVRSSGIDGFYGSALDALLRTHGIDQLLLVGEGLETCIHSTMRSANDRGYECLLVIDACTPYEPAMVASARSQVEMSGGIFGAVGTADHVCAALAAADLPSNDRTLA